MNLNELVICERRPFWSIRLRQLLSDSDTGVCETRSLDECQERLVQTRSCLAVLEVHDANLVAIWNWLRVQTSDSPHPNFVVVGHRGLNQFEWSLREAGALQAIFFPRKVAQLAPIMNRCRSRYESEDQSSHDQSFIANSDLDAIWSNLPWS